MEYKEISWFGDIITGSTPSTSDKNNYNSNDIPFIKPDDLDKNDITYLNSNKYYVSNYCRNKLRLFPKGSVLCSCIGIIGKIGIATEESFCNQQINVIIPDKNKVYSEFLAYSLKYQAKYFSANANAPVVPLINKSDFSKIKIPYYDLDEQAKIINDINAIVNSIKLNKNLLVNFDNIVKSQFIEMFGNCKKDGSIADVTSEIKRGQWGEEPILDEPNYKVIKTNNMEYDGTLDLSEVVLRNINKDKFEKNKLEYGDILVEKCGGTKTHSVGYSCLFLESDDYVANNFIMVLTPNKMKINPYFLQYQLRYMYESCDFSDCFNKTTGIQNLKVDLYKNKRICIPNMELQNKFADFVQQIDKSKFIVQKQIKLLEELLDKKMNEYFGN